MFISRFRCGCRAGAGQLRIVVLAVATLPAAFGCGSSSDLSASSKPQDPPATVAGAVSGTNPADVASPCVADIDQVVATPPTISSSTETLPADIVARLDAAARSSLAQAAAPGAIVGVRTPQGTWTHAYGESDPATGAPMEVGLHTRIGSLTKTFTGTVIMQLAQEGKLSLADPIDAYVAGVPNGDRITLRMLADMTSGVASYTTSTAFTDTYFAHPDTAFPPDQLLAIGLAESPIFEPGAQFNYSNTNTVLLGMVIEKVTGQSVGDVIGARVLEPLGLANTSWPGESTALPDPYAQGYTLQGDAATPDHPSNATHWNPAWGWTAGELISNMDDLLTYARALGTGQGLLEPTTQAERLGSFPGTAGYGIALGCTDGWVGHTGELPGYNTSVFYDTATDSTVVVQANSDIASGACPQSPTLTDDPRQAVCSSPATRMFVALASALGHPFSPMPRK
jgi:D-alanyl-D-alanine carboxypeptidase